MVTVKPSKYSPLEPGDPLVSEFDCWLPDPAYKAQEPAGSISSYKPNAVIPAIEAPDALPFVNLPGKFLQIVRECWQSAKVSPGAQRGGLQLGGARQQAFNALGKTAQQKMEGAGQHNPFVRPTNPPTTVGPVPAHLEGLARDWNLQLQIERVNAFTFRGETSFRSPVGVKNAGGFSPPITRTDSTYIKNDVFPAFSGYMKRRFNETIDETSFLSAYNKAAADDMTRKLMTQYWLWMAIMEQESVHLGRMTANQVLKGFISTSREIAVSKGYAKNDGWVYLVLVRGGYVVPLKGKHIWAAYFSEQEIALLGSISWKEIYGFRKVAPKSQPMKFTGPIYLRKQFGDTFPTPFQKAYELFSGKPQ